MKNSELFVERYAEARSSFNALRDEGRRFDELNGARIRRWSELANVTVQKANLLQRFSKDSALSPQQRGSVIRFGKSVVQEVEKYLFHCQGSSPKINELVRNLSTLKVKTGMIAGVAGALFAADLAWEYCKNGSPGQQSARGDAAPPQPQTKTAVARLLEDYARSERMGPNQTASTGSVRV